MDCIFAVFLEWSLNKVFIMPLFVAFYFIFYIFTCNSVSTDFTSKKKNNRTSSDCKDLLALRFICILKCITKVHRARANQAHCYK